MVATILDGRALAAKMRDEIAAEVAVFKAQEGHLPPSVAVVQAGADPASEVYVKAIGKFFDGVGMVLNLHRLPKKATETDVLDLLDELNSDPRVSGIIVQLPLPPHISQRAVTYRITPEKDVDGVNPCNLGMLVAGTGDYLAPATPLGGMAILERYGYEIKGKRAIVVGRSNIVGKPMAMLLLHQHATVTICHTRTVDLPSVTREGDILVAAAGKARMITADMVKPGAVVIDFGVNAVDGQMVGDVDFESVKDIAGAITPVPGGTGPMTNVMLARNTLAAARMAAAK